MPNEAPTMSSVSPKALRKRGMKASRSNSRMHGLPLSCADAGRAEFVPAELLHDGDLAQRGDRRIHRPVAADELDREAGAEARLQLVDAAVDHVDVDTMRPRDAREERVVRLAVLDVQLHEPPAVYEADAVERLRGRHVVQHRRDEAARGRILRIREHPVDG